MYQTSIQKPASPRSRSRINKAHVRVSTHDYQFVHGHEPRGRGSWAFYFADAPATPWWAPSEQTYSEARRQAIAEAQRRGVVSVSVAT